MYGGRYVFVSNLAQPTGIKHTLRSCYALDDEAEALLSFFCCGVSIATNKEMFNKINVNVLDAFQAKQI